MREPFRVPLRLISGRLTDKRGSTANWKGQLVRLSNNERGTRRRLGVSRLAIIGGLLVLFTMAVTGCAEAGPNATAEPTPVPVDATDVDVVYASRERPASISDVGGLRPAVGRSERRRTYHRPFAQGIEDGTPVDIQEEGTMLSNIPLVMNVRFQDGKTWSVRQVTKCILTSGGRCWRSHLTRPDRIRKGPEGATYITRVPGLPPQASSSGGRGARGLPRLRTGQSGAQLLHHIGFSLRP